MKDETISGVKAYSIITGTLVFVTLLFLYIVPLLGILKTESTAVKTTSHPARFLKATLNPGLNGVFKNDQPKVVVVRLLNNECKECVDSIFSNVVRLSRKIGRENIYLLFGGAMANEFQMFKRLHRYDLDNMYLHIAQVSSNDRLGLSYYFIRSAKEPESTDSIHLIQNKETADFMPIYQEWQNGIRTLNF